MKNTNKYPLNNKFTTHGAKTISYDEQTTMYSLAVKIKSYNARY